LAGEETPVPGPRAEARASSAAAKARLAPLPQLRKRCAGTPVASRLWQSEPPDRAFEDGWARLTTSEDGGLAEASSAAA
jgi:hypothetical protein